MIAILSAGWFGYRAYQSANSTRKMELQVYNQWMQFMLIANSYLNSEGRNEKPRNGAFQESPNTALFNADKYLHMATELISGAGWMSQGEVANVDGRLSMVPSQIGQEIEEMYDAGTYSRGSYQITTPLKTLVADRDFIRSQVNNVIKGMPERATDVNQISNQMPHLTSLDLGVFSKPFQNFMVSTGQMTVSTQ